MYRHQHLTAIVPARDEAAAIARVVTELRHLVVDGERVVDDIIVCDNGSTDATAECARSAGARVVYEPVAGYGAACQAALAALSGGCELVLFVDADASVDVAEANQLLRALDTGADLVVGARQSAEASSLGVIQRLGTSLVCGLIRRLWHQSVTDLGPFRLIRRTALQRIAMTDHGYGWTAEMQIRAIQERLSIVEVAVTVHQRIGRSKISGTAIGVLRAGHGLLGVVWRLWVAERRLRSLPVRY